MSAPYVRSVSRWGGTAWEWSIYQLRPNTELLSQHGTSGGIHFFQTLQHLIDLDVQESGRSVYLHYFGIQVRLDNSDCKGIAKVSELERIPSD